MIEGFNNKRIRLKSDIKINKLNLKEHDTLICYLPKNISLERVNAIKQFIEKSINNKIKKGNLNESRS